MYTLHWIILDAASECEDMEQERFGGNAPHSTYLFSIDNLQLFVYLFAPIIQSLKEQHFQTLKLENGLRLWQSLWGYRQPDVPCFFTPVKPKRNILKANHNTLRVNFNAANIYVGKGTSHDNIYLGFDDIPSNRYAASDIILKTSPNMGPQDVQLTCLCVSELHCRLLNTYNKFYQEQ